LYQCEPLLISYPLKQWQQYINSLYQLLSGIGKGMYCIAALLEAYVAISWWQCFRYQTGLASNTAAITKQTPYNKLLTYVTDNIFMSPAHMDVQSPSCVAFTWTMYRKSSVVSLSWLVDWLCEKTWDGLRKECKLSRKMTPLSSQFG
jgi:hypothetical protein